HALAAQRDARRASVIGFVGPAAQIVAIRPILGPRDRPLLKDSLEILFALDLALLELPPVLADGRAVARRARAAHLHLLVPARSPAPHADRDLRVRGRHVYMVETLARRSGRALLARARADLKDRLATAWLLEVAGEPVACQSFNATLPDMVQVGGVWTPPDLR